MNLNCMTFPDKQSLDSFGEIGNPGWSFATLQPYLRKFHTFHEPSDEVKHRLGLKYMNPKTHGTSGPIQVSYGNYHTGILNAAWPATWANLGRESKVDPCSGEAQGGVSAPGTVSPESWTRSYAAGAYLTPEVRARENLHIITHALVEKIVFDGSVAKGARYRDSDGQNLAVHGKEIILCGGVFNSPQLLELSGIGSKTILDQLNIPIVFDLPGVGENLQDHSNVGVSFEATMETFDSFKIPAKLAGAVNEYQESRSGPMTSAIFNMAFMPCLKDSFGSEAGLAELLRRSVEDPALGPGLRKQYELIERIVGNSDLSSVQYIAAPIGLDNFDQSAGNVTPEAAVANMITLFASLSHPFSRGSCHIKSSKVEDYPIIDPKYFTHPADVEIIARHLQFLRTIASTKPLADLLKPDGLTIPVDVDLDDLEYVRNKLVGTGFTTYHPCGTCAMMPRELNGVVDERLRVHGVNGLRVVDASVFPLIPRGNIQSSVYAVAEKAADFVKEDWR